MKTEKHYRENSSNRRWITETEVIITYVFSYTFWSKEYLDFGGSNTITGITPTLLTNMDDSTEKRFFDALSSLKENVTSMSNQCLDIQQDLSTILTTIRSAKEEIENCEKVDSQSDSNGGDDEEDKTKEENKS